MSLIHHGRLTVLCRATEDIEKVKDSIKSLTPFDWNVENDEEKGRNLIIDEERTEGQFGNSITILKLKLNKKDCLDVFKNIIGKLSTEEKDLIKESIDERTDDNCFFYIRLDKQSAFNNSIQLGKDDAIQFSIKLAAYPAKKENALESAKKLLESI